MHLFHHWGSSFWENDDWSRVISTDKCYPLYNHQAIDFALEIYQDYTEEMWEFVRGITFSFLGAKC